jgi:ligand-binding SRPBCC domain-containing protein
MLKLGKFLLATVPRLACCRWGSSGSVAGVRGLMPVIRLHTVIAAPIERCFDLSRDIELHMRSTEQTREIAVAGVTKGLIEMGEEVTWDAHHFGVRQRLTTKITVFSRPIHFRDSQVAGAFERFDHDHYFEETDGRTTLMTDVFDYTSPLGWLGAIADHFFLESYMLSFLKKRNLLIKQVAEVGSRQSYFGSGLESREQ